MKNYIHGSKYFYGNKISDYGLKNGYIDYSTLVKAFDKEEEDGRRRYINIILFRTICLGGLKNVL